MNDLLSTQKKLFLKGTLVLSLAALITKILSAVYRVPFQNMVGDTGFYIYQQVYPFYGLAIALATYGFPVIISKLIAEQTKKNETHFANRILIPSLLAIFLFCLSIFTIFYFGAGYIAQFLGDSNLAPLVKMCSFLFLLVPVISIFRGYFQGIGDMQPTAISQVLEQSMRVFLILFLAFWLTSEGYSLYKIGQSAIVASVLGFITTVLFLTALYLKRNKKKQRVRWNFPPMVETLSTMKVVFLQGLAICLSGLTLVLFQLADTFQIFPTLISQGYLEEDAKIIKGIYDRGQPLIQIGLVLATSFSLSIVPTLSSVDLKKSKEIKEYVRLSFLLTSVIGSGAAIGLVLIMEPLNRMLFMNGSGTFVLQILVLSVLFASLNATLLSVLQALGKMKLTSMIVISGVVAKILFNSLLVSKYGTKGAALSTNLALILMLIILIIQIRKLFGKNILKDMKFPQMIYALGWMMLSVVLFIRLTEIFNIETQRAFASFQAIVGAIIGGSIFLFVLIKREFFTKKEFEVIPFGEKLLKMQHKKWRKRL